MVNQFRVRDKDSGIVYQKSDENCVAPDDFFVAANGKVCYIEGEKGHGYLIKTIENTAEYFTGFNDKEGNPIYENDTIDVSYNKQDAEFLKTKTFYLTVGWDEYHGQWATYQKIGEKLMKYAPLYSVAKKCTVKGD